MTIKAALYVGALCAVLSLSARAAEPLNALRTCRSLSDDASRLKCYDAIALEVPVAAAAAGAEPVAPLTAEQRFGLPAAKVLSAETQRGNGPAEVAAVNLKVTSLSFGAGGRVVIGLENGQVWQQLVPSSDLELLKLGDRVEISRGLLGSFWLAAPSKRGSKVTRVR
jgi:hypothetical protein